MIPHLVIKDVLLVKKIAPIMMAILVGVITIAAMTPGLPGAFLFLYFVVLSELILLQAVSGEEEKSPKATALLCAAPYSRRDFVAAKYVVFPVMLLLCFLLYSLLALLHPNLVLLSLRDFLVGLFGGSLIFGLYTPISIRYGAAKARLVYILVILSLSAGPTLLMTLFPGLATALSRWQGFSAPLMSLLLLLLSVAVLLLSLLASMRVFARKDL